MSLIPNAKPRSSLPNLQSRAVPPSCPQSFGPKEPRVEKLAEQLGLLRKV